VAGLLARVFLLSVRGGGKVRWIGGGRVVLSRGADVSEKKGAGLQLWGDFTVDLKPYVVASLGKVLGVGRQEQPRWGEGVCSKNFKGGGENRKEKKSSKILGL